jgi:hypothetical protein
VKKPHLEINHQLQTKLIYREEWKTRFTTQLFSPDIQGEMEDKMGEVTGYQEEKTMGELELTLKKAKTENPLTQIIYK